MATRKFEPTTQTRQHWRFALLAVALLLGVFVLLWVLDSVNAPALEVVPERRLPVVSVIEVAPAAHRATIHALSEAKARNAAVLRVQVAGEIVNLSPEFMPGRNVRRGTILLEIENSAQRTLVAEAENRLAQAELALLTEERMGVTAAANWELSKQQGDPASPLVLRAPQLAAARAERKAAVAAFNEAQTQLYYAAVRAPFDGVIDKRTVSLGETIDVGQEIGSIVNQDKIDVTVNLNANDWTLLPDALSLQEVALRDPVSGRVWAGTVRSKSGVIDETTRLRRLHIEHDRDRNDGEPLLPGAFIEVSIPGSTVENALCLPESALTRDSETWVVGNDGRLQRHEANRIFSRAASVYVAIPDADADTIQVAVNPLASFVAGDQVNVRLVQYAEDQCTP